MGMKKYLLRKINSLNESQCFKFMFGRRENNSLNESQCFGFMFGRRENNSFERQKKSERKQVCKKI